MEMLGGFLIPFLDLDLILGASRANATSHLRERRRRATSQAYVSQTGSRDYIASLRASFGSLVGS